MFIFYTTPQGMAQAGVYRVGSPWMDQVARALFPAKSATPT